MKTIFWWCGCGIFWWFVCLLKWIDIKALVPSLDFVHQPFGGFTGVACGQVAESLQWLGRNGFVKKKKKTRKRGWLFQFLLLACLVVSVFVLMFIPAFFCCAIYSLGLVGIPLKRILYWRLLVNGLFWELWTVVFWRWSSEISPCWFTYTAFARNLPRPYRLSKQYLFTKGKKKTNSLYVNGYSLFIPKQWAQTYPPYQTYSMSEGSGRWVDRLQARWVTRRMAWSPFRLLKRRSVALDQKDANFEGIRWFDVIWSFGFGKKTHLGATFSFYL